MQEVIDLLEKIKDRGILDSGAIKMLDQALAKLREKPEPTEKCDDCVYLEADGEIINEHIEKEKVLEKTIQELQAQIDKQAKAIAGS